MKNSLINFFRRLTAYILEVFSNQIWFIFLSLKTVFNLARTFYFLAVNYIKEIYSICINSILDHFQHSSDEGRALLTLIICGTLEVCALTGLIEIAYAYFFLGSADIVVSNESLWLVSLIMAIVVGNTYYKHTFASEKSGLEIQIESIKTLMTQNAALAVEVSSIESEILDEQVKLLELLENLYNNLTDIAQLFDSESTTNLISAQYEELVNRVFSEHFRYLVSVVAVRESYVNALGLRDINEEIAFEAFEH